MAVLKKSLCRYGSPVNIEANVDIAYKVHRQAELFKFCLEFINSLAWLVSAERDPGLDSLKASLHAKHANFPSPQIGYNGNFYTTMAAVTRRIRILVHRRLSAGRQMVDWPLHLVEPGLLSDS